MHVGDTSQNVSKSDEKTRVRAAKDVASWSERRVGMLAIRVRSSVGIASILLDVYPQRREHFRVDMCAIQKFLFHF
jgi:hypothetical protein